MVNKHVVTRSCDYRWGFEFGIVFIDHFNTRLITTLNYSAISNFRILQFTRAHAESFPARSVFTGSCLVTAPTMAIPLLPCSGPLNSVFTSSGL
jgi:hypothetical protein